MDYRMQRKMFNLYAAEALVRQLRYSYGSDKYRAKIRARNLRRCLESAYKIPFYRRRFDDAGITPADIHDVNDLVKLPILTKEQYREWISEEKLKEQNQHCMLASTSGSSGIPLEVLNTPKEYATDIANLLRAWMVCGYNPFTNITLTSLDETSENVGYKTFIQRLGILRREYVDDRKSAENIIQTINTLHPGLFQMYKSELVRVARYAQENQVEVFKPNFYEISGENVDEISRRIMQKTFGDNLIVIYGCVENGPIAVQRPGWQKYEIFDDMVAVNLYDEEGKLTNEEGRIIFTTLYKDTFPLINYEVRDRGSIVKNSCGTYFTKILGRENDVIRHSDGTTTGWIHLWYAISHEQDILQARFIQENYETVTLQLVKKKSSVRTKDEIAASLAKQLNERMHNKTTVQIEWLEEIPADPSGKQRMIINKL